MCVAHSFTRVVVVVVVAVLTNAFVGHVFPLEQLLFIIVAAAVSQPSRC